MTASLSFTRTPRSLIKTMSNTKSSNIDKPSTRHQASGLMAWASAGDRHATRGRFKTVFPPSWLSAGRGAFVTGMIVLLVSAGTGSLRAQTRETNTNTSGGWVTNNSSTNFWNGSSAFNDTNWSTAAQGALYSAVFTNTSGNIAVNASVYLNSLIYTPSSGTFAIGQSVGQGTLNFAGANASIGLTNTNTGSQALTVNSAVALATNLAITNNGSLTVIGNISGAFGISAFGSGTTTLTASNSFSGAVNVGTNTVFGGTLVIQGNNSLGNLGGVTTGVNWGTLLFNGAGTTNTLGNTSVAALLQAGSGKVATWTITNTATVNGAGQQFLLGGGSGGTNILVISGNGVLTNVNTFQLGRNAGTFSDASYFTNSGGSFYAGTVSLYSGSRNNNQMVVTAGTNTIGLLAIGASVPGSNSISQVVLNGGLIRVTNAATITLGNIAGTNNSNAITITGGQFNNTNKTITFGSAVTVSGLTNQINLGGGTLTVGGFVNGNYTGNTGYTNIINWNGGGVLQAGASTGASFLNSGFVSVTIGTGGGIFDANGFSNTIAANIGGTGSDGGLTVTNSTGSGTLTLSGSNSFNGLAIVGGTLVQSNAYALGSNNGTLTLTAGTLNVGTNNDTFATVNFGNGALAGTGTLSASTAYNATNSVNLNITNSLAGAGIFTNNSGSATTTLTASNSFAGLTVAGGTVVQGTNNALGATNGTLTLGAGTLSVGTNNNTFATVNFGNGTLSSTAGGGTLTASTAFNATNSANLTLSNTLTGAGSLTKSGAGTLSLTGINTYGGPTAINGGTLSVNATNTISSNSAVSLSNLGVFQYKGGTGTLGNGFSVTSGTGIINNTGGGTLTLSGTLDKTGSTLDLSGGNYNVTGKITGTSGTNFNSDLILSNALVTLSTAADYYGPTYLVGGSTLNLAVSNALPTNTALYVGGSGEGAGVTNTLNLGGKDLSIAHLYSQGGGVSQVYNTNGSYSSLTITGDSSFGGTIGGSINLAVAGGHVSLTGNNDYTGGTTITTVGTNHGTIDLGGGGSLPGTTNVVVNAGSSLLLGGGGRTNPVNSSATLSLAGTISAGGSGATNRTASQTFSTLTLTGNSVIDFANLTGTSSLTFSSIVMNGHTLSIYDWNGTTLWGTTSNTGGVGQYTHLFDTAGGLSTADLNNISFYSGSGSGFLGNGTFSGTEIVPVPEPSVVISGLLLLGFLLYSNRHLLKVRLSTKR